MVKNKKEEIKDISEDKALLTPTETTNKTCFVIMPIADTVGYEHGHFMRVYRHLIKPACERAGFTPIRADDVSSSNMIVVDILKKIVESDIAICDLSSRNPNVLYELGLRQAFNKKTIIIKDKETSSPFDVSGFRYTEYDQVLRIDNVQNEIISISKALKDTFETKDDINSIVQLLKIKPAEVGEITNLNVNETYMLNVLNGLNNKLDTLAKEKTTDIEDIPIFELEGKYRSLGDLLNVYSAESISNKKLLIFNYKKEKLGSFRGIDYSISAVMFDSKIYFLNEVDLGDINFEIDVPF